jgi:hypothetical protein
VSNGLRVDAKIHKTKADYHHIVELALRAIGE